MSLQMTSGPAIEPITLAEAKAHLRVDGTEEDQLISSLILTSRLHIEAALGLALITQAWKLLLDKWPKTAEVRIRLRPLQSVSEVKVYDTDGQAAIVPPEHYISDTTGNPGRLVPARQGWPQPGRRANGIEIAFTAGYGDAETDVPAPIRQALLLLVAHWYEHRDPVEIGTPGVAIPAAVSRLLKPYRLARL
ncbi:MAG: head-tail connector protein [Alphaproteobacteria bacterium]|nr:head-tail connector protein [Alphaproteobacteria bacterium]